ncbi:MAG TPA: YihY/virulence factor BrkB family protein [Nocardioidaceae bacterium]|nr:YihY/virulence factor BrkB family protein [Nocardioidaceae bacterium]
MDALSRVREVNRILLHRLRPRPRRWYLLSVRSAREFVDDECPQLAAAISYHVLLSIFPLIILLVSLFGLVVDDRSVRDNVVAGVTTYIPLTPHGTRSLEQLVTQMQGGSAALGIAGVVGLVISASGMMTATRRALSAAWDAHSRRNFVRGKLFDLLLVGVAAVVLGVSFGLTVAVRLARSGSEGAAHALGPLGPLATTAGWLVGFLVPLLLAFALFSFFFAVVPAVPTQWLRIWPGALVGAVGFQLLKEAFAFYLDHFAHYNAVYGSLGAAAAFIFFVYLSANVFLLGAEVAAEYPRLGPVEPLDSHPRAAG